MASLSIYVSSTGSTSSSSSKPDNPKSISIENPTYEGEVVKPAYKRSSAVKAAAVAVLLVVGVIVAVVALVGRSSGSGSSASGDNSIGVAQGASSASGSVTCQSLSQATQAVGVLSQYASAGTTCASRQEPLVANVTVLSSRLSKLSDVSNKTSQALEKVVNKTASLDARLDKMASLARKVPKFGKYIQLALQAMKDVLGLLRKVQPRVTYVNKVVSMASKLFKGMAVSLKAELAVANATALALRTGSAMGEQAVRCAAATASLCQDDDAVLKVSAGFNKEMEQGYRGIDACIDAFAKYDKFVRDLKALLNEQVEAVLEAVAMVLEAIDAALQPVINAVNKVLDAIANTATEAYCCGLPYFLHKAGDLAGKVADLVACPVDGALDVFRGEVNNLVRKMQAEFDGVISKVLQPVLPVLQQMAAVSFRYPVLSGAFALNNASCALTTPTLNMLDFKPFQEAVESLTVQVEPVEALPGLFDAIAAACNSALTDLKGIDPGSCCTDLKAPKQNGDACDPTGVLSTQESCFAMCPSGTFQSWPDQSVRCGVSPRWPDGTLCGAGTTCGQCQNTATYWFTKAMTACGPEPKTWADGTACAVGTTCNACMNTATYWYQYAFTLCGKEPGWPDGTVCALGSSCNACTNQASYWYGKAFTACGREPCWGYGTLCAAGTSCNNCCVAATWYWSGFGFYCN